MKEERTKTKALALRYSEKFAPPEGTIQAHLDVLNAHGYVWYGKIGKTISDKSISDLLKNGNGTILLIDSGKTDRYWVKITDIKKEEPSDGIFPNYYLNNKEVFNTWFKVIAIKKAPSDVLSHCTVISSGAVLSLASKQSMSPFFMVEVEEGFYES